MAEPPATPPSSDIVGIHRDEPKIVARSKDPDPGMGAKLAAVKTQATARPPYDPEIATEGNSQ